MNRKFDNGLNNLNYHSIKNNPWKPVFLYGSFGILWIYFSDSLLAAFVTTLQLYEKIQTIKGSLFIFITSILLYMLIRFDNRIIYNLSASLNATNNELKEQRSLVQEIFEQSNAAIMIWSVDGTMIEINDYFTELFGYTADEIVGKKWCELMVSSKNHQDLKNFTQELLIKKRTFNIESDIITKSGQLKKIVWNQAILDSVKDGQPLVASYGFDTTKEVEQAEEIYQLAFVDTLTNLDNRAVYEKNIKHLRDTNTPFTIYLVDIDDFKHLNEVHGHAYGDLLLIDYAKTLKSALIHHNVYRWGGDQFLILEQTTNNQATQLTVDNILSLSLKDWKVDDIIFACSVSIGIANHPEDSKNLSDVYRNAEIALYAAKEKGKATYQYYEHSMLEEIEYFSIVEHELVKAMDNDHLDLYFQPIHCLKTNKIVYYEVLLRWFNPTIVDNNIGKIIEIAEKTEQIKEIDKWVVHNTFKLLEVYKDPLKGIALSINLSAQSFRSEDFINYLVEEANYHQITPGQIQLEITEHSIIKDIQYSARLMHRLKNVGFSLALDDFGTRYSSLNYLSKLPFNTLKLDKSYVDYLLLDNNDHAIIEMLIRLSNKLKLKVIAEGIEKQAQFDELHRIGCDYGQGYLMAKPQPVQAVLEELTLNTQPQD